jgi:hypothetical protein
VLTVHTRVHQRSAYKDSWHFSRILRNGDPTPMSAFPNRCISYLFRSWRTKEAERRSKKNFGDCGHVVVIDSARTTMMDRVQSVTLCDTGLRTADRGQHSSDDLAVIIVIIWAEQNMLPFV